MKRSAEELADFIEKNPNCIFEINNDSWFMRKAIEREKSDIEVEFGEEYEENQIADYSDYSFETKWYGSGQNYGHAIAEALVILLNRRGFKIKAEAV